MKNKKICLIILDGLGFNKTKYGNAFLAAKHPNIQNLLQNFPWSTLQASGNAVGLPDGQMGNSEIGHMNIGCGRIIKSELVRINDDIENNNFLNNPNLLLAIDHAKRLNSNFHIIGMTSNGGIHSKLTHILETIKLCGKQKVKTIVHCLSDGRDTSTHSFINDLPIVIKTISQYPDVYLGTIGGRYYGMDRNKNWHRVQIAIDATEHKGQFFIDPISYIKQSYDNDISDEFIVPAFNKSLPHTKLTKNDVVFVANFRPDRVRQMCHLFKQSSLYDYFSPYWKLQLFLSTMVKYDGINSDIIVYAPLQYQNTLGKVLEINNLKQLRIAETEKYAHVTFFFDGGREINYKNEQKILIPSPNVATYDMQPEMSANIVCDKLIANLSKYDVIICNFANCDMVGHTGNWNATIKAIETIDKCLGKIMSATKDLNITLFVTADHGNCDYMLNDKHDIVTTHSLSPVFFICTDKNINLKNGCLSNIAPTILKYLGIKKPIEMTSDPLF